MFISNKEELFNRITNSPMSIPIKLVVNLEFVNHLIDDLLDFNLEIYLSGIFPLGNLFQGKQLGILIIIPYPVKENLFISPVELEEYLFFKGIYNFSLN